MAAGETAPLRTDSITEIECYYCHQTLRVPRSEVWACATCPSCHRWTNYRSICITDMSNLDSVIKSALGEYPTAPRPSRMDSIISDILAVLGVLFVLGGMVLFVGNISGMLPTLPFAGFVTGLIGSGLIAASQHAP